MPTAQQKKALDIKLQKIQENKPIVMGEIMREAGYSDKASEHPARLEKSKGWQELLALIDEKPLLARLAEIAMDTDKRASIAAIQELLKLKDRYPEKKLKLGRLDEEMDGLT